VAARIEVPSDFMDDREDLLALDAAIGHGIAASDAGRVSTIDDVRAEWRARAAGSGEPPL
jgi:hypothetical protein